MYRMSLISDLTIWHQQQIAVITGEPCQVRDVDEVGDQQSLGVGLCDKLAEPVAALGESGHGKDGMRMGMAVTEHRFEGLRRRPLRRARDGGGERNGLIAEARISCFFGATMVFYTRLTACVQWPGSRCSRRPEENPARQTADGSGTALRGVTDPTPAP